MEHILLFRNIKDKSKFYTFVHKPKIALHAPQPVFITFLLPLF